MAAEPKKKPEGLIGKITGVLGLKKNQPTAKSAAPKAASPFSDAKKSRPAAPVHWPANRLNVVEKLWGLGYTTPGGADFVKLLLPLLGLDEKKSLLLLGAGLGGICETIAEETGVWITGYEPDKELAKMGQESMKRAGLQRKAPIRFDHMEDLKLKPKSFDAMMAFDAIHTVKDKKALFTAVSEALRLDGEMLFISYVLPNTNPPSEKVQIWARHQSLMPHLWPQEAMVAMLQGCNLDVRPPDDITHDFRVRVLKAWMDFLSTMKKDELLNIAADLVGECERWADLITAIDCGDLKVMKYHCIKLPDQRKSVHELMAKA
ncbi:class I SAM-dependent methyltransferase [Magnetovibrio sp.]|uniref:class I SAM-dependent methyltransferase n=1 Tax=Magnetovibrio sp. TaxID=2024836 RepID=UPI002F95A022